MFHSKASGISAPSGDGSKRKENAADKALFTAAQNGDVEGCKLQLQNGASPNVTKKDLFKVCIRLVGVSLCVCLFAKTPIVALVAPHSPNQR